MKKTGIGSKPAKYEFRVGFENSEQNISGYSDVDAWNLKQQQYRRYSQDTEERKLLSHWVMSVVSVWLVLVLFIVAFNEKFGFKLQDSVLITLLATTTANILGLAFIVLRGLFNDSKKD